MVNMNILINGKKIGKNAPVYIVAEMSANHNQSFDTAVEIITSAKNAGADAVKLQTYTPDSITIDSSSEIFMAGKQTVWKDHRLYDLYKKAHTPWHWHPKLKEHADRIKIDLFSSPFSIEAIEFLEQMSCPAYKVASFEITDFQLLKRIGKTGKPVIMSTGMATVSEIKEACEVLRKSGTHQLALLKCTSCYPAEPREMHLRTIAHMAKEFGVPIGLSDHTLSSESAIAAVSLGACIVEKHYTLSRKTPGPDSAFSFEPDEFKKMVAAIRNVEQALGSIHYGPTESEKNLVKYRRSLFVVKDMRAGEPFTEMNVRSIRPAHGLHPRHLSIVLQRRAAVPIKRGTPLSFDLIAK